MIANDLAQRTERSDAQGRCRPLVCQIDQRTDLVLRSLEQTLSVRERRESTFMTEDVRW